MAQTKLTIINRSFWPHNQVIGEALLQFAEEASVKNQVSLITQANVNLKQKLREKKRGEALTVYNFKAFTSSSSFLISRITETVFFMLWVVISLVRERPNKIYIATDPPVLVPFVVCIYSKIANSKYYYHIQDIHPEATNIIIKINKPFFCFLRIIDNISIRNAEVLITLTTQMKEFLVKRSGANTTIYLLDNPAVTFPKVGDSVRDRDIVFCGNAGRLQRIPLLIDAITLYIEQGGKLRFTFIGGGVYAQNIEKLSIDFDQVEYLGVLPAKVADETIKTHRWALLPIVDETSDFAFPSKTSSYVVSGCKILGICGLNTSVAHWIEEHSVGIVCLPSEVELVNCFKLLEKNPSTVIQSPALVEKLGVNNFVKQLAQMCGLT